MTLVFGQKILLDIPKVHGAWASYAMWYMQTMSLVVPK